MTNIITKNCDSNGAVTLVFGSQTRITVNNQTQIDFPSADRKALRMESALLRSENDFMVLRARSGQNATTLTAAQKIAAVTVRFFVGGVQQEEVFQNVKAIEVSAAMIRLLCESAGGSGSAGGNGGNGSTVGTVGGGGGRTVVTNQPDPEKEELKRQLAKAMEEKAKLQRSEKALKDENNQLKTRIDGLNRAVEAGVDRMVESMHTRTVSFSDEVQRKLRELERLGNELAASTTRQEEIQAQIDQQNAAKNAAETRQRELQAELTQLQNQVGQLQGQAEITELDCQKAREDLKALQTRLQMSADVVELTESRWLKNNSVADTMKEMQKKIAAVEDRIGFILNARERYGTAVQNAIMVSGDGTVSVDDESGNGARQPAEEPDTPDTED